jgi:hypothetical protein
VQIRVTLLERALGSVTLFVILGFLSVTAADADLWGHLLFGRDIVRDGWVHTSDPYSFTSDRPWINHEWLAEAIMWAAYSYGGAPGLVALKLLPVVFAGSLLLLVWRRFRLTPPFRDSLLFVTALGVWPLVATIRPQAFSVALFAALLFILDRIGTGRLGWMGLLPPLFALWVNVHGGWLVGGGVLAIFAIATLFDSRRTRRSRLALVAVGIVAAAATLCNPYGIAMLDFLGQSVRPERADIMEWQPVHRLPLTAAVLWAVPALVAAAAFWRGRRQIPFPSLVVVLVLAIASLSVARLGGFFALAVGMWLAPYIQTRTRHTEPGTQTDRNARPLVAAAVCLGLVAASTASFGRQITIAGRWAPEPEAVAFVHERQLNGRMLTWFDYGQYAIWHLWPAIRVSMDGRRETVYSDRMRDLHARVFDAAPDGLEVVESLDPDYIWLPAEFPILNRLESAGWHPVFEGPRSKIYARRDGPSVRSGADGSHARAFPGP